MKLYVEAIPEHIDGIGGAFRHTIEDWESLDKRLEHIKERNLLLLGFGEALPTVVKYLKQQDYFGCAPYAGATRSREHMHNVLGMYKDYFLNLGYPRSMIDAVDHLSKIAFKLYWM